MAVLVRHIFEIGCLDQSITAVLEYLSSVISSLCDRMAKVYALFNKCLFSQTRQLFFFFFLIRKIPVLSFIMLGISLKQIRMYGTTLKC